MQTKITIEVIDQLLNIHTKVLRRYFHYRASVYVSFLEFVYSLNMYVVSREIRDTMYR